MIWGGRTSLVARQCVACAAWLYITAGGRRGRRPGVLHAHVEADVQTAVSRRRQSGASEGDDVAMTGSEAWTTDSTGRQPSRSQRGRDSRRASEDIQQSSRRTASLKSARATGPGAGAGRGRRRAPPTPSTRATARAAAPPAVSADAPTRQHPQSTPRTVRARRPIMAVFGEEVAKCVYSKDWHARVAPSSTCSCACRRSCRRRRQRASSQCRATRRCSRR